jgi:thiol-disulfide isomerase/thioredoxin
MFRIIFILLVLTGCATIQTPIEVKKGSINHIKISQYKRAKAQNNGQTVFMFSADWCEPCKIAKPILEKEADQNGQIIFEVEVDDFRMWDRMPYKSLPTFIFSNNGKEEVLKGWNEEWFLKRYRGFFDPDTSEAKVENKN